MPGTQPPIVTRLDGRCAREAACSVECKPRTREHRDERQRRQHLPVRDGGELAGRAPLPKETVKRATDEGPDLKVRMALHDGHRITMGDELAAHRIDRETKGLGDMRFML